MRKQLDVLALFCAVNLIAVAMCRPKKTTSPILAIHKAPNGRSRRPAAYELIPSGP